LIAAILTIFPGSQVHARGGDPVNPTPEPTSVEVPRPEVTAWSFAFPIDRSGNPLNPNQPNVKAFGYGICSGSFQNLAKQGSFLIWGAQSSCTASNNFFYLHQVKVDLYDSCLYGLCIFFEKNKTIVSPVSSNYSRVATANVYDFCKGRERVNSRTYEQRVYVTIRDITFGPFAQLSGVPNCDIQP
jgi:hypothetical protein